MWEMATKSYYRREINRIASHYFLRGKVLDLGGGSRASYLEQFRIAPKTEIISLNINPDDRPIKLIDLEKGIPEKNHSSDVVLAFNIFEHIFHYEKLLSESFRVLKRRGMLYASTPFLKEIHADPKDYSRLTAEAWRLLLKRAGYQHVEINEIALGPLMACYTIIQAVSPTFINALIYPIVFCLDSIFLSLKPSWRKKFLLGLFIKATK